MNASAWLVVAALAISGTASADIWTCRSVTKVKVVTVERVTRTSARQSFEVYLHGDGTFLVDNHVNSFLIPGTFYLDGKKAYLYPDRDAQYASIFEVSPTISSATILSSYITVTMSRRPAFATKAAINGHTDMYLYLNNGTVARSTGNSTGKCKRLQ